MTPLVLFNHFSPHPNAVTGITVYSWRILEALARTGRFRYVLSTNWDLDRVPAVFRELGVELQHRPNVRNEGLAWLNDALRMGGIVRRSGADLVFSPHPFGAATGTAPRISVAHDLRRVQHPELHNWRARAQWNAIFPLTLRRASAVIAVSGATRDAIARYYPDVSPKVRVVHEASPLPAPGTPPPRPEVEGPYGLMVANVTAIKKLGVLTDALRSLKASGRSVKILLVGRDDSGDEAFAAARSEGLDLQTVGTVNDAELQRLYAHAAFYVNTSLVEGFCLPILEAQESGCPIVCSDLPVLREVAGEGAIFYPPGDSAALAEAMTRLLEDPETSARLRAAAAVNVARFSWAKAATETEAVFDSVLAR